ncbi:hypothetical protein SOVF_091790 [Spinacia oleracea]|uniref:Pentatricopeptide repeat-containing protein At3g04130, mitochondrial n=1 Tax=Spinacia oleracea TaxID=3562 RepID=A0A9R0K116_SPIOL|nr:pentatricopeptide repeat-containing protein At3g04130, mitochondrial [Spinacia oleracea]KNA16143.1 hypothetical protein SOVF_091790 [Spinacia oleracea]
MISYSMQHLLLKTLVRNCLNERVLKLLIASVPLHFRNVVCGKGYGYAKFSTYSPLGTSQFKNPIESSELQLVVNKVHVGSSEDEILSYLVNDEVCEGISVSHALVDSLLHRFKDDWKSALGVFRWTESRPNFEHLPEAYDSMVDILGKARQFDKMSGLMGEMLERELVTLRTMAIVMRRFAGARRWSDAVRTFDELGTFGLKKNAESMNLLLDTLCKESQVQMARAIFLELKSHILPTVHTFNIFVHGWCKIKRVEEAYWTLQEMKGHGFRPCVISYSTIIQTYCRLSNWNKTFELLEMMESQGCKPSVVTYTTIMSSLSKADKLEDALQIADRAKLAGCELDVQFYNALIHTLGKAQRITEAFNIFKVEMPNNGVHPSTSTYNTLIGMFCRNGQEEMAFNILDDMEKAALCKPDLQTFYPLLKACFRLGMLDSCLSKLLDDMAIKHHLSLDDSTYSLLIHGLCRVDKCEWAFRVFEEMVGKDVTPRYQTCRLLLDQVKEKNMYAAVEKVELYFNNLKASFPQKFSVSRTSIESAEGS